MSIATCMTAAREVVATAVNAKSALDSMPAGLPLALPAVIVEWQQTAMQARMNMGNSPSTGKWKRIGVRHTHMLNVWVLVSTTQAVEAESVAVKAAAQAILSAVAADGTLRGTGTTDRCIEARVRTVQPYQIVSGESVVFAGVQAAMEIDEEG